MLISKWSPVRAVCMAFIACLSICSMAEVYFSENFEKADKIPDWQSWAVTDSTQWITVCPAAAATGNAGVRIIEGPDHLLGKTLFWQSDSPQIIQGFYCTFAVRLHRRNSIDSGDVASFSELAMFNLAMENDQFYSNPTLLLEKRDDSLPSLVLLQRRAKGDDPVRIPAWDNELKLSFETWYSVTIFMRIKELELVDSLFINDRFIGQGGVELKKRPGFLQVLLMGFRIVSKVGAGSVDFDNIILSSHRPESSVIVPPAQAYAVVIRNVSSGHNDVFYPGDTMQVEFTFPPFSYPIVCIDMGLTSELWKGPRSPRWGQYDSAFNFPFSLGQNFLFMKYPAGSDMFRNCCGIDTNARPALARGICDSCQLDPSAGTATATIILAPTMRPGKWMLSSYLMNAQTARMDPFPSLSLTVKPKNLFIRWIISIASLVIVLGSIVVLIRRRRNTRQVVPDARVRVADAIDAFIRENYAKEEITSVEIAKHVFLSEKQAVTNYKAVRGISPVTMLRNVRIEVACSLLRTTDSPVSTISYKTGFSDPVVFQHIFKKIIGKTPGQYREECQKSGN